MIFWLLMIFISGFFYYRNRVRRNKAWKIMSGFWLGLSILFLIMNLTVRSASEDYKFTDIEAKVFADYYRENAHILDNGNKIQFVVGTTKEKISVRVGEAWKHESVSRKIYLSNELLKEKNRLFQEWLKSKNNKLDSKEFEPDLVVTVSDEEKTIISQEYKDEMVLFN